MTDITARLLAIDIAAALNHYREQRGEARAEILSLRSKVKAQATAVDAAQETIDLIQRRNEALTKALKSMINLTKSGDFSTGDCCCGNSLENGRISCDGHMSVDAGDYQASCAISAAVAVLMKDDDGDGG